MHAPDPEFRDFRHHLDALAKQVRFVPRVHRVLKDSVDNRGVAVDALERDFPLVVALAAVDGRNGIECAGHTEVRRVALRRFQMVIAVKQQLARRVRSANRQKHRQAVGFRIPVRRSAEALARVALRSNIQPCVAARVGAEQLEEVEVDALLRAVVALNLHIRHFPALVPRCLMRFERLLPSLVARLLRRRHRQVHQLVFVVVAAGEHGDVLFHRDSRAGVNIARIERSAVAGFGRHINIVDALNAVRHCRRDGEALYAVGIRLRLHQHAAALIPALAIHHVPEGLVVVRINIADVAIQIGRNLHPAIKRRRHLIANRQQLLRIHRHEAPSVQRQAALVHVHAGVAVQHGRAHIHLAFIFPNRRAAEVERMLVDDDMDADEVDGVDNLRIILRIAFFPPSDACLIGIPHAAQIRSLKAVAGIIFLKIAAQTHIAVRQRHQRLGEALGIGLPAAFDYFPRMHGKAHCFSPPLSARMHFQPVQNSS